MIKIPFLLLIFILTTLDTTAQNRTRNIAHNQHFFKYEFSRTFLKPNREFALSHEYVLSPRITFESTISFVHDKDRNTQQVAIETQRYTEVIARECTIIIFIPICSSESHFEGTNRPWEEITETHVRTHATTLDLGFRFYLKKNKKTIQGKGVYIKPSFLFAHQRYNSYKFNYTTSLIEEESVTDYEGLPLFFWTSDTVTRSLYEQTRTTSVSSNSSKLYGATASLGYQLITKKRFVLDLMGTWGFIDNPNEFIDLGQRIKTSSFSRLSLKMGFAL